MTQIVGHSTKKCISYTQLERVLKLLDYQVFKKSLESIFGVVIQHQDGEWYAIDGKELRGSINTVAGEKRG